MADGFIFGLSIESTVHHAWSLPSSTPPFRSNSAVHKTLPDIPHPPRTRQPRSGIWTAPLAHRGVGISASSLHLSHIVRMHGLSENIDTLNQGTYINARHLPVCCWLKLLARTKCFEWPLIRITATEYEDAIVSCHCTCSAPTMTHRAEFGNVSAIHIHSVYLISWHSVLILTTNYINTLYWEQLLSGYCIFNVPFDTATQSKYRNGTWKRTFVAFCSCGRHWNTRVFDRGSVRRAKIFSLFLRNEKAG